MHIAAVLDILPPTEPLPTELLEGLLAGLLLIPLGDKVEGDVERD